MPLDSTFLAFIVYPVGKTNCRGNAVPIGVWTNFSMVPNIKRTALEDLAEDARRLGLKDYQSSAGDQGIRIKATIETDNYRVITRRAGDLAKLVERHLRITPSHQQLGHISMFDPVMS